MCPRSLQYPIEFSNGAAWRVVDCQHLTTHLTKDYDINDKDTPPKFNMEPENDGLEDDFPFPGVYSQVPC